jgi:hypothetical protein
MRCCCIWPKSLYMELGVVQLHPCYVFPSLASCLIPWRNMECTAPGVEAEQSRCTIHRDKTCISIIQYPVSILWVVYFCSILHLFAHTYHSFTFFSYVACFLLLRFGECFTVFHILICACPLGCRGDFGEGRCVKSQTYRIRKSPVYSAQLIAWPNLAEATSHQQFQDISRLVGPRWSSTKCWRSMRRGSLSPTVQKAYENMLMCKDLKRLLNLLCDGDVAKIEISIYIIHRFIIILHFF